MTVILKLMIDDYFKVFLFVNPMFNFEFCKRYYPRIAKGKMNGRVARLLVFPLITALEKTIGKSDYLAQKFLNIILF